MLLRRNSEVIEAMTVCNPGVLIRPARSADAERILAVQAESWAGAYARLLPRRIFPTAGDPRAVRFWQSVLMEGTTAVRVAEAEGGALLGFASGGNRRDANLGADGEIHALYLRPSAQGRGLGRRLFASLARVLRARSARHLGLWVLAGNAPAIAFYQRLGGVARHRQVSRERGVAFDEIAFVWDPIDSACD